MIRTWRKPTSGTTVLEVLISIFVLLVGLTGVLTLFPVGARLSQMSADDVIGSMTAQNAIAAVRVQTGLLRRVKPWSSTNDDGDVLAWNGSASEGMDGGGGTAVNVGGAFLGINKIEPTLYKSGNQVSATIPREGLVAWFDASVGVTTIGSVVQQWADQSGNGRHATLVSGTPTVVQGVLNGRPVIRFDDTATPTSEHLRFTRLTNIRTVFWVIKENAYTPRHALLGDQTYSHFSRGAAGEYWSLADASIFVREGITKLNGTVVQYPTDDAVPPATRDKPPLNNYNIISLITTSAVSANQITQDRASFPSWLGDIAEIIIYSMPLKDADEITVGSYLAAKYGITGSTYPVGAANSTMFDTRLDTGETTRNDCALMLMTGGKAQWKLFRLDHESTVSPAQVASTVNACTNFTVDGIRSGDSFTLIGARSIKHVWATAPAGFYGTYGVGGFQLPSRYRLGPGALPGYGYLAIIHRVSGSTSAFRIHVLVYRGYDENAPPEGNDPAIGCYATILSGDVLPQ